MKGRGFESLQERRENSFHQDRLLFRYPFHIIGGSCQKYHFLSRQKFCRDKHVFVATKHVFVPTKYLSRQAYFCRDKKPVCRDKSKLVVTKLLSRQNYVCRDKSIFAYAHTPKKMCFVLSQQTRVCRELLSQHVFVATKSILMTDPTNDSSTHVLPQ